MDVVALQAAKADAAKRYAALGPKPSGDATGATDTAAIQAAIDAAYTAGGGTVQLRGAPSSAPYWITSINLKSNVELVGLSAQGTVLSAPTGHDTNAMINLAGPDQYGWAVRRLTVNGGNGSNFDTHGLQTNTFHGINIVGSSPNTGQNFGAFRTDMNGRVDDVIIANTSGHGFYLAGRASEVRLTNVYVVSAGQNGYRIDNQDVFLDSCSSGMSGHEGFLLNSRSTQLVNCKSWWSGRTFNPDGHGFRLTSASAGCVLSGCFAQDNYADGFSVAGSGNLIAGIAGGNTNSHVAFRGGTDCDVSVTMNTSANQSATATYALDWSGTNARNKVVIDGTASITNQYPAGADFGGNNVSVGTLSGNNGIVGGMLANGEETIHRLIATGSSNLASGSLTLTFFTARKSETITQLAAVTRGTAAAGTTFARMGLYKVNVDGTLTLLAGTTSDTTLFGTTFTQHTRALGSGVTTTAGQRYAFALLWSGTTAPILYACSQGPNMNISPAVFAAIGSQSDLPASIAAASVTGGGNPVFGMLVP